MRASSTVADWSHRPAPDPFLSISSSDALLPGTVSLSTGKPEAGAVSFVSPAPAPRTWTAPSPETYSNRPSKVPGAISTMSSPAAAPAAFRAGCTVPKQPGAEPTQKVLAPAGAANAASANTDNAAVRRIREDNGRLLRSRDWEAKHPRRPERFQRRQPTDSWRIDADLWCG